MDEVPLEVFLQFGGEPLVIVYAAKVDPLTLFGLAGAALALGTVYWLVRERST